MERIQAKRKANNHVLERVITALNTSLHSLEGYKKSVAKAKVRSNRARRALNHATTDPATNMAFEHGSASTAVHSALSDLYNTPYACMCYVVIEGEEQVYANPQFEQIFYSVAECNRRLKIEGQSPTQSILCE